MENSGWLMSPGLLRSMVRDALRGSSGQLVRANHYRKRHEASWRIFPGETELG